MKLRVSNKTLTRVKVGNYFWHKGKKYMIVSINYFTGKLGLTSKITTNQMKTTNKMSHTPGPYG